MDILYTLIRIYTPFIMASALCIYGILYFTGYRGLMLQELNNYFGHSFIVIIYMFSTSRHMCIWYKSTLLLLLMTHVVVWMKIHGYTDMSITVFGTLCLSSLAFLSFLIYRSRRGITKFLRC